MRRIGILLLAMFIFGREAVAEPLKVPDPRDYPAVVGFKGTPASPILDTKFKRLFRTRIREEAKKGPNFSGHYTVVAWGCGMDSYMLVVVDAITGKVYEPPFKCLTLAGGFGLPIPGLEDRQNPGFRIDSKLLLTIGVEDKENVEAKDRVAVIYLFEDNKFKPIYQVASPLEN